MILSAPNSLNIPPASIVSLVPSQTELLHYLGLEQATRGITKFCIHPNEWFRNKIRVGGTKDVDIQAIKNINPDLVIANKEENVREQVETIAGQFPVWLTDVNTLEDALAMIGDIGQLTHKEQEARTLAYLIAQRFAELPPVAAAQPAAYFIWKRPYMTVGGDTFINDMMQRAGFRNIFSDKKRYPTVTPGDLLASGCKVLLLSGEPYPFKEKDIVELQEQLPGITIRLVDGEMFSWYGSRLLHAPAYFKDLQQKLMMI